jgi:hypothetical protein
MTDLDALAEARGRGELVARPRHDRDGREITYRCDGCGRRSAPVIEVAGASGPRQYCQRCYYTRAAELARRDGWTHGEHA